MSPIEIVAVLLGLANIILIVRRSLWNYPFGIAMVSLYFFIFFEAKLYSDALLQIFFFAVQLYGWWNWLRGRDTGGELIVRRAAPVAMALWTLGLLIAIALWGWLMHSQTDAAFPWWDGAIGMISVGAQLLMSRRFIENWWFWVLTDLLAAPLYAAKGLWPTTALYVLYLGISVWGWRAWLAVERQQQREAVSSSVRAAAA